MSFLIRRPDDTRPSEITPPELFRQRRMWLRAAGLAGLGIGATLALARSGEQPPLGNTPAGEGTQFMPGPRSPFSTDEPLTPYKDITTYNNFYEFGSRKSDPERNAGRMQTRPWTIAVSGLVKRPRTFDLDDLLRLAPLEERIYRLRCVEAWSMVIPWQGLPLAAVLKEVEPLGDARYVRFTTHYDRAIMSRRPILDWPYREGLRLDEALHPLTLLASGLYGETLPNQNGAPLRLVVPWKYGFKSIKSIVAIELLADEPATAWGTLQPEEYGFYANVNPDVSHPRWSQASERRIGELRKRATLPFNGYAEQVAQLYAGMDLRTHY